MVSRFYHTFKNCFATVLSVFSFNNNKFNPNRPQVSVWVRLMHLRLRFSILFFFHTFWGKFYCYGYCSYTVHEQQPQSLTCQTIFSQSVHTVHCLRTHKFYFSTIFSLKIDPTVLFTYLKTILLQCFSVFNCIQTDPFLLFTFRKTHF